MSATSEREAVIFPMNSFQINVDTLSHEWEVAGHQLGNGEPRSHDIHGEIPYIHWRMKLSHKEKSISPTTVLTLMLTLSCSSEVEIYVDYHFLVNGKRTDDRDFHSVLRSGDAEEHDLPITALYRLEKGAVRLYDCATIVLNLSQELSYAKYYDAPSALEYSMGKMLDNGKFTDMVIETEDGMKIPVHQAVLHARSPVFCAMLESDMQESRTKVIKIPDFSSETVKDMVYYLYTGRIPKLRCHSAAALFMAADKYEVSELMTICSENLALNLCIGNAVQLLLLADAHGATSLKEKTLKFIAVKRSSFVNTAMFKQVKHLPNLLLDVISALAQPLRCD